MPASSRRQRLVPATLLLLTACAGPTEWLGRAPEPIQWPGGQHPPRIEFVLSYRGSMDVARHPGFWSSLGGILTGTDELELISPSGLAWSPPDRLWVADPGLGAVHRIDLLTGEHLVIRGSDAEPMPMPVGVTVGEGGEVFVSDSSRARVLVLDAGGSLLRAFGSEQELGRPTGLAWDPVRHRLLVVDTTGCRVLALDANGKPELQVGGRGTQPGQFNFPTNLAIAADGHVFVVDSLNYRVQELDENLQPRGNFGSVGRGPGCFSSPKGVALDRDGHVYVVDAMFDNVQIFQPNGQLLLPFGSHGSTPGQLQLPAGICIDANDRIFVADPGNGRIQIYRYLRSQP